MPWVSKCLAWPGDCRPRPLYRSAHIGARRGYKNPAERSVPLFGVASLGAALLGCCQLGRILCHENIDRATGLLDRRGRALRNPGHLERNLAGQFALAEQADAILAAACHTGGPQRCMIDDVLGVELAGFNQLLDLAEVDLGIVLAEWIVEAPLRQPHVQRHLAALETLDGNARPALLALLAAPAGLAFARAYAASDAGALLAGTGIVTDVVEFHVNALAFAVVARMFNRSLRPYGGAWRSRRGPPGCPQFRRRGASSPNRDRSGSVCGFRACGSANRSA